MEDFKNKNIGFGENEKDLLDNVDNETTDDLEFKVFENNQSIDFESKIENEDNEAVKNFQEVEAEDKSETRNIKIKLNSNLTNAHTDENKANNGTHKIKLNLNTIEKIKINRE